MSRSKLKPSRDTARDALGQLTALLAGRNILILSASVVKEVEANVSIQSGCVLESTPTGNECLEISISFFRRPPATKKKAGG